MPRLIEFGLLQAAESGKPQAILEAKKKLLDNFQTIAKIFPTQEEYLNPSPEQIERTKKTLLGS